MELSINHQGGHSADVKMHLKTAAGATFTIAQMGPDFLILDDPRNFPACEADIHFSVDESHRQWRVTLPNGISRQSRLTAIAPVPAMASRE